MLFTLTSNLMKNILCNTPINDRINVLHCTSSLHVGGINRVLLQSLKAFSDEGVRHHVCYFVPRHDLLSDFREAGIEPFCLGHQGTRGALSTLRRLNELVSQRGIDVIHTHIMLDRLYAGLVAKLRGIPIITSLHATNNPYESPFQSFGAVQNSVKAGVEDAAGRFLTDRFVAVSDAVKDIYVKHRWVPAERTEVVYNGIDVSEQLSLSPEERLAVRKQISGVNDPYPLLINVGRLVAFKGQNLLVPMMEKVLESWPRAVLVIAGGGELREGLQAEIDNRELQNSIKLLGQRNDVERLLAASDIFVFPSNSEGLPMAVIEAMGSALPVIAFDWGPLGEVVEHGVTGSLVPLNEVDALVTTVSEFCASPANMRATGEAGKRRVAERFNIEGTAARLENLYRQVHSEGSSIRN